MAYYTALISAWNNVTQPPPGITGTGLTGGMTTAQKLAAVNGWTVTGSVPTTIFVTGDQVLNCINYSEFKVLTATQQSNLLNLCSGSGKLLGGSGNTALITAGMIIDYFPPAGATIANLTALSQAVTQNWCLANGYPVAQTGGGGLTLIDANTAGLS